MTPDELDWILLSEKRMEASPSFAGSVMARILVEAAEARPAPFPWLLALALLACATPLLWLFPAEAFSRAMNSLSSSIGAMALASLSATMPGEIMMVAAALLGSLALVWLSLRLARA